MSERRVIELEHTVTVTFSVTYTAPDEVVVEWANVGDVDAMNQDRELLGRLAEELEKEDACYSDWEEFAT